ncbi:hypothetical protein FRC07_001972, partial [Ceratobasidium sp. 392]
VEECGVDVWSSGGCTDKTKSNCNSFQDILCGTINGVCTLKSASNCPITLTGGTEVGHASGTYSHANGYKVDIRKNTCLNDYVHNNFDQIEDRADGFPQWKSKAGNIYCDEDSHWDVTYHGSF